MIKIDLGSAEIQKSGMGSPLQRLWLQATVWATDILSNFSERTQNIVVFSVAVSIAIFFPLFFNQYERYAHRKHLDKIAEFQAEIDRTQQEMTKNAAYKNELLSYEKQKKVILERLEAVRGLLNTRSAPVLILDTLGQSLPSKTWFSKIDVQIPQQSETALVTLTGQSYSSEEVSDFVDRITESVYFTDVVMGDVFNSKIDEKVNGKTFSITARARVRNIAAVPPAPPAQVKK